MGTIVKVDIGVIGIIVVGIIVSEKVTSGFVIFGDKDSSVNEGSTACANTGLSRTEIKTMNPHKDRPDFFNNSRKTLN